MKEVQLILTIPISRTNQSDALIWRGTSNGSFFVKSAYHMYMEVEERIVAGTSSTTGSTEIWKKLWALSTLNVEKKNFLWRACHDILPMRENLMKRKFLNDPACPLCGFMVETGFHTLWQCPATTDVCSMSLKKFQKSYYQDQVFWR